MTEPLRRVLVFDGDCRFCSSVARWVARRLPPGARTIPWQEIPDPSAVGLTRERIADAAWWIDGSGRPHRGHLAARGALREIGGLWRVVGESIGSPVLDPVAAWAYDVIARNRHRLPGGTPACGVDAGRAAPRPTD